MAPMTFAGCLDAHVEEAVERHAQAVVDKVGSLDITINLIGVDHIQGRPLVNLSPSEFTRGFEARVRTHFVTARAAARHMVRQGSGVILMVTTAPDRTAFGLHAANAGATAETFASAREERILLRRLPALAEVADVAAFMASDRVSAITASVINLTCGELLD